MALNGFLESLSSKMASIKLNYTLRIINGPRKPVMKPIRGPPYHNQEGATTTGTVGSSWVALYCFKLSTMFQCHLNVVLFVSQIGGMKYLFKYG